ncbi:DUF448 domain-containing protein [Roseomonas sp. CCTCC AB2023176]|uniref:DUF448 domain-containing protein n=1 Tax=Roseomonas sp. CCTCC AB2023176 TaxID=3342640 RepID=UPI0035DD6437
MIRFVLAPSADGGAPSLVPDLAGRLPGRGMWLSARGDVLERAVSRGAFLKAARGPVLIPPPGWPPRSRTGFDAASSISSASRDGRVRQWWGSSRRGNGSRPAAPRCWWRRWTEALPSGRG